MISAKLAIKLIQERIVQHRIILQDNFNNDVSNLIYNYTFQTDGTPETYVRLQQYVPMSMPALHAMMKWCAENHLYLGNIINIKKTMQRANSLSLTMSKFTAIIIALCITGLTYIMENSFPRKLCLVIQFFTCVSHLYYNVKTYSTMVLIIFYFVALIVILILTSFLSMCSFCFSFGNCFWRIWGHWFS